MGVLAMYSFVVVPDRTVVRSALGSCHVIRTVQCWQLLRFLG